jgi:hypothetical protein
MSQENVEIVRGLYPPEGIEMVALVEDVQGLKRSYGPILHPDFEVSADPEALTMVGVEGSHGFWDGRVHSRVAGLV